MYIIIFLLAGIGAGLESTTALLLPGYVFDKNKDIALAVSSTGGGIGMLTIPYLLHYLIREYGWRYTIMLLGCGSAQGCIVGLLSREREIKRDPSTTKPQAGKTLKLFFNFNFDMLFLTLLLWNFGGLMSLFYLADMVKESGFTKEEAALTISMIGASSIGIRIILSITGTLFFTMDVLLSFTIGCILCGMGIFIRPFTSSHFWFMILGSVISGTGYGIQVGMMVPSFLKLFSPEMAVSALGLALLAVMAGSLCGPIVAGTFTFINDPVVLKCIQCFTNAHVI